MLRSVIMTYQVCVLQSSSRGSSTNPVTRVQRFALKTLLYIYGNMRDGQQQTLESVIRYAMHYPACTSMAELGATCGPKSEHSSCMLPLPQLMSVCGLKHSDGRCCFSTCIVTCLCRLAARRLYTSAAATTDTTDVADTTDCRAMKQPYPVMLLEHDKFKATGTGRLA